MGGTMDRWRRRSHVGTDVSSGGGEAWRSQWRRRRGQAEEADLPEAAVEPKCHRQRCPPHLKASVVGACCSLPLRFVMGRTSTGGGGKGRVG
jgi:hypothetical protein